MKDTVTRMKEKREAEAKRMVKEAAVICGSIILVAVIVIVAGVRIG